MKKYLVHVLTAVIMTSAIVTAIMWIVDPYMYFHYSSWHKTVYFINQQRFQNAGIALNQNYDSVVIGTSMAENFSTIQIDKKLGWKTVNLSISGSSAHEQRRLLEFALKTSKVKNVLWVVQWDSFAHPVDFVRPDAIFPEGIYDGSRLSLFQNYLMNTNMLAYAARVFFDKNNSMDTAWNWAGDFKFGCASVASSYNDMSRNLVVKKAFGSGEFLTDAQSIERSIQKNLRDVVKHNPDVRFILVIPPYSKWSYKALQNKSGFTALSGVLNFREKIASDLNGFSNVSLLDYQSDPRIILDAADYKDTEHYSPRINAMMVDEIANRVALPMQSQSEFLTRINRPGNCLDE